MFDEKHNLFSFNETTQQSEAYISHFPKVKYLTTQFCTQTFPLLCKSGSRD